MRVNNRMPRSTPDFGLEAKALILIAQFSFQMSNSAL